MDFDAHSTAKDIAGSHNQDERKVVKQVFAYGVPEEVRPEMEKALQGLAKVNFPSIKRTLAETKHRMKSGAGDVIALWGDSRPADLDKFTEETGIPILHVTPVENPRGDHGCPQTIGLRFREIANVSPDEPLTSGSDDQDIIESAEAYASLSADLEHTTKLVLKPTSKKILIVAPRKKWLDQVGSEAFGAFVESLNRSYSDYDFALVVDTSADYFEWLQSGSLFAVIRQPMMVEWSVSASAILTNDEAIFKDCKNRSVTVLTELDFEQWQPLPEWMAEEFDQPPASFVETSVSKYVTGCYYFLTDDMAGRFDGLKGNLVALYQARICASQEIIRVEHAIPDDEILNPDSIHVERLSGSYPILHFDNRTRENVLTCILPFRYSVERKDALRRLRHIQMDSSLSDDISFLLVDDGSDPAMVPKIREACADLNISYIYVDTSEQSFSVGRCRNIGAEYACSEFIFMQDIDLMPYEGFYRDLLLEIAAQGMQENACHFLMIPYIFLTSQGTELFRRTDPALRRQRLIQAAILNDKTLVEKFSTGTSANLYNRLWYLSRGGNSQDFVGWGYEDLEFNSRMIRHLKHFPMPEDWSVEEYNFNSVTEYRTYKAVYRLFGDMAMMKGIVLFHAWHPVFESGDYAEKAKINREIFIKKLQSFPKTQHEPDPLPDRSRGKTLVFRKNAFTLARTSFPAFGEVLFLPRETNIPNKATFEEFVRHHGISRVLFFNPFQTPHMRRLQQWTRDLGLPFLVGERGALPNTSFYDSEGFLADSSTYDPERWDHELNLTDKRRIREYVSELRHHRPELEQQPPAVGGAELRRMLGIGPNEIVIFVPLQRPGDTVTRFFGRGTSYLEFEKQVAELAAMHVPGVRLLVKTHPLEEGAADWGDAIISDNMNVYDLLEASDLVWTFNSGTGVLAMAWYKPCALSGKAFYKADGVNHEVSSVDDVLALARAMPEFNVDRAHRFLHHLIEKVYSFGQQVTKAVRMADGSRMTATMDIQYSTLRVEERSTHFRLSSRATYDTSGVLFDRYRYAMKHKKR